MFYSILMYWKLNIPILKGKLFKLFYQSKSIKIGRNFRCDSFPEITITQNGKLTIGDNVLLRRNVEIRSHNDSEIILGNNIRIDRGVRLLAANQSKLILKDKVRVGLYSVFNGGDSITVEKNCLISGFVYLQTSMHRYKGQETIQNQGFDHAPILLEEDVWLGAHSVILPGITLKKGAIVGSNAVVNKNVEKETIVGGVPAKILKSRNQN